MLDSTEIKLRVSSRIKEFSLTIGAQAIIRYVRTKKTTNIHNYSTKCTGSAFPDTRDTLRTFTMHLNMSVYCCYSEFGICC